MTYTAPTASDLKTRYPAFAAVSDEAIDLWLDEAAQECASWQEGTRARAEMAYAAHKMVETAVLEEGTTIGVTSFRSGDFSATVGDKVAARTGFDATVYGREFLALRRRNFAGPRLAWTPPAAAPGGCDA